MINRGQIQAYLRLKTDIANFITHPDSGFQESRRHLSEGLARSMLIHDEEWTYSTKSGGYTFTNPKHRFSIFIAEQGHVENHFTTEELVNYLQAFTQLQDINSMVVDTWLTHMAMRGEVQQANRGWSLAAMKSE